mgnify:CR=1 FL=1
MSNLSIAIIGAGYIADEHAKVVNSIEGLSLLGVHSRTHEKLLEFSKSHSTKAFKDIDSLLDEKPDGIIIAVSADQVFEVSKILLPFKIPLLIEKPPGLSLLEIKELARLAKESDTQNMVGLNRRHMSHFLKGIEIIKKQGPLLGLLVEGHERLWQLKGTVEVSLLNKWIYANSIHTIDLIRFFGGDISEQISFNESFGGNQADQLCSIFKMENKCLATYISNWHSPGSWGVKLMGDGVSAVFSPLESGITIDKSFSKTEIAISKFDKIFKPGFYNQMQSFRDLIRNGKLTWPSSDLEDTLKTYHIASKMILESNYN